MPNAPGQSANIDDDLSCLACGYNLRGLFADATCPECGTAIAITLQGDTLRTADPKWVRRLAQGCGWVIVGGLTLLFTPVAAMLTESLPLAWFGAAIGIVISNIGSILLTEPQPDRIANTGDQARIVARWSTLVCGVAMLTVLAAMLQSRDARLLGAITILAVLPVSVFATLTHQRHLAQRLPAPSITRQMRIFLPTIGIGVFAMFAFGLLGGIFFILCGFFVGIPFMALWWLIIIGALHTKLVNVARSTEQRRNNESASTAQPSDHDA